jgi:hypothetical protein
MAAGNVRVLVAGLRTATPDAATRAALAPLVASLHALAAPLPSEAIDARRAVLGDHANSRAMLRSLFDSPTRPTDPTGVASVWLTHEAATLSAFDAQYADFIAWLDAPDHATRPPPRAHKHAEGFGWWLWNPGGKLALDLLDLDLGAIVRNIESGRARADAAFAALAVDLSAVPAEFTQADVEEAQRATATVQAAPDAPGAENAAGSAAR